MVQSLPIRALIEHRCRELGLTRADLIRRTRYKDVTKGMRRLEELCEGDLRRGQGLVKMLPAALGLPAEMVEGAVKETWNQLVEADRRAAEEKEARWRAAFEPHAIILTEKRVPEPIFVAGLIGIERLLRVDLDLAADRSSYVYQALNGIRAKLERWQSDMLPAFGRPTGVVVNYAPEWAVRYDLEGNALEFLPKARRPGEATLSVGGRELPPGLISAASPQSPAKTK